MGQRWDVTDDASWRNLAEFRTTHKLSGKRMVLEFVEAEITPKQFNSLHVWFRHCAQKLRDAGIDMRAIMAKRKVEVPVTEHSFKETCYKPLLAALEGKESTKDQDTKDSANVREVLHRHFADKHNVQLPPWPDRHSRGME